MKHIATLLAPLALALAATGSPAAAAVPMYPDIGVENPVLYAFTASATGRLYAYYTGSTGLFTNVLGLVRNGGPLQLSTLNSTSSTPGDAFDFGDVELGDVLTFAISVNAGEFTWYSNRALNADGSNHVWSTAFSDGDFGIPPGTFVAFEDLDATGSSDFNYADIGFVFTNVTPTISGAVPEPATWAMIIIGFGAIGSAMRRQRRRISFA